MNKQATELKEIARYLVMHGQLTYAEHVKEAAEVVNDIGKILGSEPQPKKIKLTKCEDALPPEGLCVLAVLQSKSLGDEVNVAQFMYRKANDWFFSWNGIRANSSNPKAWVSREDVFKAMRL